MFIISNRFGGALGHTSWFKMYRAGRQIELWFGRRYVSIGRD